MAKCKACNKRIDFDERDQSVKIGASIRTIKGEMIEVPVYGKFAYIRRGRWYWHPECYPAKLTGETKGAEYQALQKEKLKLDKTLKIFSAENEKILEERDLYKNDYETQKERYEILKDKNTALTSKVENLQLDLVNYEALKEEVEKSGKADDPTK